MPDFVMALRCREFACHSGISPGPGSFCSEPETLCSQPAGVGANRIARFQLAFDANSNFVRITRHINAGGACGPEQRKSRGHKRVLVAQPCEMLGNRKGRKLVEIVYLESRLSYETC